MKKYLKFGLVAALLIFVAGNIAANKYGSTYTIRIQSQKTWNEYIYLKGSSGSEILGVWPGALLVKDDDGYSFVDFNTTDTWVHAQINNHGPLGDNSGGGNNRDATLRNDDNSLNADIIQIPAPLNGDKDYSYWDWGYYGGSANDAIWNLVWKSYRQWPKANIVDMKVPTHIYVGDKNLTFGVTVWGTWKPWNNSGDGEKKYGRIRVAISQTKAGLATATPADYSAYTTDDYKEAQSPQFTAAGSCYWAVQAEYDWVKAWFARNSQAGWQDMITLGELATKAELTVTVAPIPAPQNVNTVVTTLSWTKNLRGDTSAPFNTVVFKVPTSNASWDPTPGIAPSSQSSGYAVEYFGSGSSVTITPQSGFVYKIYTENWSYYSAGVQETLDNIKVFDKTTNTTSGGGAFDKLYYKYEPKTGSGHFTGPQGNQIFVSDVANNWDFISLPFDVTNIIGGDGSAITLGTTSYNDAADVWLMPFNEALRANTGSGFPATAQAGTQLMQSKSFTAPGGIAIWVDPEIIVRAKVPNWWLDGADINGTTRDGVYIYRWDGKYPNLPLWKNWSDIGIQGKLLKLEADPNEPGWFISPVAFSEPFEFLLHNGTEWNDPDLSFIRAINPKDNQSPNLTIFKSTSYDLTDGAGGSGKDLDGNDYIIPVESRYISKTSDYLYFEAANPATAFATLPASKVVNLDYTSGGLKPSERGYNLVGNPMYANVTFTLPASGTAYYKWAGGNPTLQESGTFPTTPFTSFYVKANTTGKSITFSTTTPIAAPAAVAERLTLTLNDTYETYIRVNEEATLGYDDYDAPYMTPIVDGTPEFYTLIDGVKIARNTVPSSTDISLGFAVPKTGEYTISWENQVPNCNAYLNDLLLDKHIDMSLESSYTFTANAGDNVDNRFTVGILRVATGLVHIDGQVKAYSENKTIVVEGLNAPTAVSVYDLAGRTVANQISSDSFRVKLQQGVYVVCVGDKRVKLIND